MRTLAIDCATEACSVGLFDGDQLVAGEFRMLGRGHAEQLVPMIDALPERGRAERVAIDLGPGSFTGIRVGLAAGRALALAWQAEVVGYTSATLLAAMAAARFPCLAVDVAMTGGHGEWFFQPFDERGQPLHGLRSMAPSAAVAASCSPLVTGSQAEALVAARANGAAILAWPDARQFTLLPPSSLRADVLPAYGRAPDARLPSAA